MPEEDKATIKVKTETEITGKETVDVDLSEKTGETKDKDLTAQRNEPLPPTPPIDNQQAAEQALAPQSTPQPPMAQPIEPLPTPVTPSITPPQKPPSPQTPSLDTQPSTLNTPRSQIPAKPLSKNAQADKARASQAAANVAGAYAKGGLKGAAAELLKKDNLKALGKELGKQVLTKFVGLFGWPCLLIALIICIIIAVIALTLFASASDGSLGGKSTALPSGKDYAGVKTVLSAADQAAKNSEGAGVSGQNLLGLNSTDKKAIEDGLIDKRLLDALNYLSQRHLSLGLSHLVSDYKNMVGESGANSQLKANVSAHQEGMAADISSIDFVYKTHEFNKMCCKKCPKFDIVYYSDEGAKIGTAERTGQTGETVDKAQIEAAQAEIDAQVAALDQMLQDLQDNLNASCANATNPKVAELKQKAGDLRAKITDFHNKLNEATQTILKLQAGLVTASGILQAAGQNVPGEFNDINKTLTTALTYLETINRTLTTITPALQAAIDELDQTVSESCDQISTVQFDEVSAAINNLPDLPVLGGLSALGPLAQKIADQLQQIIAGITAEQLANIINQIKPDLGTIGTVLPVNDQQLLRLSCAAEFGLTNSNTTFKGQGALAIPIKVEWQDPKPDAQYIDPAAKNDCLTHESVQGPLVCQMVFRPEAQRKVYQLITEALQYPYDMGNKYYYRLRQIITYSKERDVLPFWDKLKDLYGLPRGENIGLFQMPEAWAQLHIAY